MKNLKIIIGIFALIVVVFLIAKGGYKKSEDTAERANTTQSSDLKSGQMTGCWERVLQRSQSSSI